MDDSTARPKPTETPLFAQVSFHIILSDGLSPDCAQELRHILKENGAVEHSPPSTDGEIALEGITHIITSTIDFKGHDAAENRMLAIVKPSWVEGSVLKKRLANTKSHSPDPRLFFSGMIVCTADLPDGDKDAIIGGVLAMGGLYSGSISKLVTHVVALNMEPQACKVAVSKNLACKIVLPHWFDDCLRLGRRIDESPYLLPDPEIARVKPGEHVNGIPRPDLQTAMSIKYSQLPASALSPSKEREELNVFQGTKVLLSGDLEISTHLRRTIEDIIMRAGGDIVEIVTEADTLICQYREGHDYRLASTRGLTVGNLSWLYHLISHNKWTSPYQKLLHYPIAQGGLPGFRDFRISLSNYNGEARIYLESLVRAAGCEFTKTMKMDNTHLITAHTASEKCMAAREWNITIVNHLWLEESYAKWQIQNVTNPRYLHFPVRTNLGEVAGQTPIDKDALETFFFPKKSRGQREQGHNHQGKQKADPVDAAAPNDAVTRLSEGISGHALSNKSNPDRQTPKRTLNDRQGGPFQTPKLTGFNPDGKENETPSTSGSRAAKEKAVLQLHALAPDIALYERERKRVGGVVFGGRKSGDDVVLEGSRKRSTSADSSDELDFRDPGRSHKRSKKDRGPPSMRLLVTGYRKWAEDNKSLLKDKERLRELGVLVTSDPTKCSCLAAPKILRTHKFICAIAHAPTIVNIRFAEDCLAQNKLLRPEDYLLDDDGGEARYRLKLSEVIERAKINKGRLLKSQRIHVTENIHGGFETYKSIIEANGGRCFLYRARSGTFIPVAGNQSDSENEDPEFAYLISGASEAETKLWPKFRQMARESNRVPRIVKTDWMLDLALSQQVRWDDSYEMNDVAKEKA